MVSEIKSLISEDKFDELNEKVNSLQSYINSQMTASNTPPNN